jgi:hypothetical protein
MSACKNCLRFYEKEVIHEKDEKCPIACSGIICSRCNMKGHIVSDCTEKWAHYTRPVYLEDLIPIHLRKRFDIHTSTPIEYCERKELSEEINDINTIIVELNDKSIREMLKYYGVGRARKQEENIHLLTTYAREHGMKIKFIKKF